MRSWVSIGALHLAGCGQSTAAARDEILDARRVFAGCTAEARDEEGVVHQRLIYDSEGWIRVDGTRSWSYTREEGRVVASVAQDSEDPVWSLAAIYDEHEHRREAAEVGKPVVTFDLSHDGDHLLWDESVQDGAFFHVDYDSCENPLKALRDGAVSEEWIWTYEAGCLPASQSFEILGIPMFRYDYVDGRPSVSVAPSGEVLLEFEWDCP